MKKQFVVFGMDRFGTAIARTLQKNGCRVIAVDKNPERIQMIASDVSYAMSADIEDPDIISVLGLRNVDGAVICIVEHLQSSIVAAMVCQEMKIPYVIARASSDMHGRILERLGVSKIVYPEQEMGERMGRYLAENDFMDWISLSSDVSLVELRVQEDWVGKSLAQLELRRKYDINVVGCRVDKQMSLSLGPDEPLTKDMTLYVIGSNEHLNALRG